MGAAKETALERYICEVPRYFAIADATSEEELKTYVADELRQLLDTPAVKIEKLTAASAPTVAEATKSRSRSIVNNVVHLVDTGKHITKVTGGTAFLGVGGADILFNKDAAAFFGVTKFMHEDKELNVEADEGVAVGDSFFSYGASLRSFVKAFATPVTPK